MPKKSVRTGPPQSWREIVDDFITFVLAVPWLSQDERDLCREGMLEVELGGRRRVVHVDQLEATMEKMREHAREDGLRDIGEPAFRSRGLRINGVKFATNLDAAFRCATNTYHRMLVQAPDATSATGASGDLLHGEQRRRYGQCLKVLEGLCSEQLTETAVQSARMRLRRALGRKAGPENGNRMYRVMKAADMAIKEPNTSIDEIARRVGMSPRTLERSDTFAGARKASIGSLRRGVVDDGVATPVDESERKMPASARNRATRKHG